MACIWNMYYTLKDQGIMKLCLKRVSLVQDNGFTVDSPSFFLPITNGEIPWGRQDHNNPLWFLFSLMSSHSSSSPILHSVLLLLFLLLPPPFLFHPCPFLSPTLYSTKSPASSSFIGFPNVLWVIPHLILSYVSRLMLLWVIFIQSLLTDVLSISDNVLLIYYWMNILAIHFHSLSTSMQPLILLRNIISAGRILVYLQ